LNSEDAITVSDHLVYDSYGNVISETRSVLGDMNGDGTVDDFDIAAFELALANPTEYVAMYPAISDWQQRGDVNDDGAFNDFDESPFEALLGSGQVEYVGHSFLITYAGMQPDDATGLFYDHARYYDAATSTFISTDPAQADLLNTYRYATDSPTNFNDPNGLISQSLSGRVSPALSPVTSYGDIQVQFGIDASLSEAFPNPPFDTTGLSNEKYIKMGDFVGSAVFVTDKARRNKPNPKCIRVWVSAAYVSRDTIVKPFSLPFDPPANPIAPTPILAGWAIEAEFAMATQDIGGRSKPLYRDFAGIYDTEATELDAIPIGGYKDFISSYAVGIFCVDTTKGNPPTITPAPLSKFYFSQEIRIYKTGVGVSLATVTYSDSLSVGGKTAPAPDWNALIAAGIKSM
jgi:RHS repeat-associated protein